MNRKKETESQKPETKRASAKTSSFADVKHYEVHRLLEYPAVRKIGPTAKMNFEGEFTPGADIESEIDKRLGSGWYRIVERLVNNKFGVSWVYHSRPMPEATEIETSAELEEDELDYVDRERVIVQQQPLDATTIRDVATVAAREVAHAVVASMPKIEQAPPQQSGLGLSGVLKEIETLDTIREKLSGPAKQPESNGQQQPQSNEMTLLFEALKFAKEANDPSLVEVIRDYISPPKEPSFIDSLGSFLEKAMDNLPTILQFANRFMPAQPVQLGQVQSTPVTGPGSQNGAELRQGQQLAQPGTTTEQGNVDPIQRDFQRVIRLMLNDLIDNVSTGASADRVINFLQKYPEQQQVVGSLILSPPVEVLKAAAAFAPGFDYTKFPHAEEWMTELQAELKAEGEEEPEPNQSSVATSEVTT